MIGLRIEIPSSCHEPRLQSLRRQRSVSYHWAMCSEMSNGFLLKRIFKHVINFTFIYTQVFLFASAEFSCHDLSVYVCVCVNVMRKYTRENTYTRYDFRVRIRTVNMAVQTEAFFGSCVPLLFCPKHFESTVDSGTNDFEAAVVKEHHVAMNVDLSILVSCPYHR